MSYNISDAIAELKALALATPKGPPLPTDLVVDKCEEEVGFRFPPDYRTFLKEASNLFVGAIEPLVVTEARDARGELSVVLAEARHARADRHSGFPNQLMDDS